MNYIKVSTLSLLTLLFVGCSNTPKESINDLFNGLKNADMLELVRNSSEGVTGAFATDGLKSCSVNKKEYIDDEKLVHDCLVEKFSDLSVRNINLFNISDDQVNADVIINSNSKDKLYKLKLIKTNFKWIVNNAHWEE